VTKVLVVDDHADLLELLDLKLSHEGYTVYTAEGGNDALEKAQADPPDLILLDIMMPDMNGWEVCKRIRETSDVPIIMVTAKGSAEDIIRGLNLGADEYITKPFSLNALAARIEALLRRMDWDRTDADMELDELKRTITTTVSHELRTPLATLTSTLDLALQHSFQGDMEAQREFIRLAQLDAQSMRWLIDDLLLVSRIDQGLEIVRRETSIWESLQKNLLLLQPQLDDRDLKLFVDCPTDLMASVDPLMLDHAVRHLGSNGIKFGTPTSRLTIIAKLKDEGLVLMFHNHGQPIEPGIRSNIFDRFVQGDQGDARKYGGLGIGLTIAQAIARAHGGKISYYSAESKGTTFRLLLPQGNSDWNGTQASTQTSD
jgi:DNA-binding response OmpR family regulator